MKPPIWLWFVLPLAVLLWGAQEVASAYARYQGARAEVRALEREAEALTRSLPQALAQAPVAAEELPPVYEALLRLAAARELDLKRLEPGEAESLGEVRAWRVELALEGSYPGVLAYLEALPKVPHPLWVEGYTLAPAGGGRGERLALDLTLRVLAP
jgi:Tfp pilus assembly protein PilO